MAIRTTLGYPGETQEDFILKDWVQEMKFDRMGCLPTRMKNTHAYLLEDDVPADVKQDRANEIMELQSQISWDLNQLKLKHSNVLSIERRAIL
jgi:ribosomal protein S12 methylthiotransferase